jgi:hypothetical protein
MAKYKSDKWQLPTSKINMDALSTNKSSQRDQFIAQFVSPKN